jgi:hypothetical protein
VMPAAVRSFGVSRNRSRSEVRHCCGSCGHDQPIGWITMKGIGQPVQSDDDVDIDRHRLNDSRGRRLAHRRASKAWASSMESSGSACSTPDPHKDSQGCGSGAGPADGGVRRATGLPCRVINTASPPLSTWRIKARQVFIETARGDLFDPVNSRDMKRLRTLTHRLQRFQSEREGQNVRYHRS